MADDRSQPVAPIPQNQDIGPLLMLALAGHEITTAEEKLIRETQPLGVTLFGRNLSHDVGQIKGLTAALQDLAPSHRKFVIAIDQEGGRVARLKPPFPNLGPARHLEEGSVAAPALGRIAAYATEVGLALLELGINCDFAPVADVLSKSANTAIGDRAFATDAAGVTARAGAFQKGLRRSGVLTCLKHFPGQGGADFDTHLGQAEVDRSEADLRRVDLVPFAQLQQDAPLIMMGHCVYPVWDDKPATLSRAIIAGILRGELGYDGVVVSDDMNMGAMPSELPRWQEALVASVVAGCDLLLICEGLERCWRAAEALQAAWHQDLPDFRMRVAAAQQRLQRLTVV